MSVQRRGRRYYSRLKIPTSLRCLVGKSEIVRSLRTSRLREARQRALLWEGRVSDLLFRIQSGLVSMSKEEIARILARYEVEQMEVFEEWLALDPPEDDAVSYAFTDGLERNYEDLVTANLRRVTPIAEELLRAAGIELAANGDEFKKFCRGLLISEQRVLREQMKRFDGDYSSPEPLRTFTEDDPVPNTIMLSDAIEQFAEMKDQTNSWRPRTSHMARKALSRLLQHVSDRPVGQVTAELITAHIKYLRCQPGRANATLSEESLVKELSFLRGLFGHLIEQKVITSNPVPAFRPKKTRSPDELRDAYSPEDLTLIFVGDFRNQRTRRPDRYWICLLLLHTGARPNEIAQLYTSDVVQFEGIWCIQINDGKEGQSVKVASTKRMLPLHPWIVEHGFLDYVQAQREKGDVPLWPLLTWSANGPVSAIGSWFNKRTRSLGIDSRKKTLYSFRHGVATQLERASVEDRRIKWYRKLPRQAHSSKVEFSAFWVR